MNPGQTMSMNLLPGPKYVVWIIIDGIYIVYFPMTSEQRIDGKSEGFRILMTASI